ncbi:MAG: sulfatase-like hydrolase/transferase, partial [Polyangiales bacterium]
MPRIGLHTSILGCVFLLLASSASPAEAEGYQHGDDADPPNILFIILDDAGIDQMTSFGNGGDNPPIVPNIDTIAKGGVKFTNTWAMPECSPSRATVFTGRFPSRTGVTSAILPQMLASAQTSPYETTLPRLLRTQKNYTNAMVGKYHLGNNNPSGNCSPSTRGFDHFDGNMEAGPPSIDTHAGDAETDTPADSGKQQCGFYSRTTTAERPIGACYFEDGSCAERLTGKECLDRNGLLALQERNCERVPPSNLNFERTNGYYVWPDTTNTGSQPAPAGCGFPAGSGCADLTCSNTRPRTKSRGDVPIRREYMTRYQTQASIDWWERQRGPRMLTVSYNSIHTPYQQPPGTTEDENNLQCIGQDSPQVADQQELSNLMFEDMDREIGVLLQELNLATLDSSGKIRRLHLDRENTILVIIGDNGTYEPNVRPPFSNVLAKGSVWQTGVWVPLIVAGAQVKG